MKIITLYITLFLIAIYYDDKPYVINLPEVVVKPAKEITVDSTELEYLARIIYAEGSSCKSDYYAIAHVVKVRSKYKNKSIIEIISNKKQFNGYKSRKWYKQPNEEAYIAAYACLSGQITMYPANMYYFHNPETSTNQKWVRAMSKYSISKIGKHIFCYNKKIQS